MINANELRIGNLVEYRITDKLDERKEWWEVSEIDADDIHWLSKVDTKDEDFRAIPLTEEWLLKFRFKEIVFTQDRNREWFKMFEIEETDELFSLCFYPEKNICYLNFDVGYGNNVLNIEHVHQLQNLYFALTGSELTVA